MSIYHHWPKDHSQTQLYHGQIFPNFAEEHKVIFLVTQRLIMMMILSDYKSYYNLILSLSLGNVHIDLQN